MLRASARAPLRPSSSRPPPRLVLLPVELANVALTDSAPVFSLPSRAPSDRALLRSRDLVLLPVVLALLDPPPDEGEIELAEHPLPRDPARPMEGTALRCGARFMHG